MPGRMGLKNQLRQREAAAKYPSFSVGPYSQVKRSPDDFPHPHCCICANKLGKRPLIALVIYTTTTENGVRWTQPGDDIPAMLEDGRARQMHVGTTCARKYQR